MADTTDLPPAGGCLIQFAANLFYAKEVEGEVILDVLRFGDLSGACSVRCKTEDLSARAGARYQALDQVVQFRDGEDEQSVRVRILQDPVWNTVAEFGVRLSEPKGCELGKFNYLCRVKVIDEDLFPSNRHREAILKGKTDDIPVRQLAWDFIMLALGRPRMRARAFAILLVGFMHNLHYLLTIYLKVYLVNVVITRASSHPLSKTLIYGSKVDGPSLQGSGVFGDQLLVPGHIVGTAAVVGALYLLPFALLHCLDALKRRLGVPEELRGVLQSGLIRRYLNYSPAARAQVSDAEVALASVGDAGSVVDNGVMKVFQIAELGGQLLIVIFFLVTSNAVALIPLTLYPLVAAVWLKVRAGRMARTDAESNSAELEVVRSVHQAYEDYQLIWDYRMVSQAVDQHERRVHRLNKAQTACAMVELNNSYFFPWLTTLSMAVYIVVGIDQLISGRTNAGTFLATFAIFKEVGEALAEGYDAFAVMGTAFALLRGITRLLNLPTDHVERLENRRRRVRLGHQARHAVERGSPPLSPAASLALVGASPGGPSPGGLKDGSPGGLWCKDDLIPIELTDLTYHSGGRKILDKVTISAPQGVIVAVVGSEREGKTTLMRLLAQALLPQEGIIFFPPHLRILQVVETPHILKGRLRDNLAFGDHEADPNLVAPQRLVAICRKLGLGQELLQKLQDELKEDGKAVCSNPAQSSEWYGPGLTQTDRTIIHLARALVSNPNVLVLHRPLMRFFTRDLRSRVLATLREFVQRRGVGFAPSEVMRRRPRTVFFTCCHHDEVHAADVVWRLQGGRLQAVEVTEKVLQEK